MKKLILTALAVGLAAALQPAAHAQFGSGIVFDPTQAGHAVTQIENEERSIANEVRQIEQGQQIFTNTVKIATTALQAYNVESNNTTSSRQMILAPGCCMRVFCLRLLTCCCCSKSRIPTAIRWVGSTPPTPEMAPQPRTNKRACPTPTT